MAAEVDERIVAAKFDSSDFEKGVDKTLKKLDELKKGLKLDKASEGITDLSKKTAEATESTSKNVEKLTDRVTTFAGMMKQKLLSGLADQVVGVFFQMEKAALRFAKSMTFDQISEGLAKYESALTSVRMIVSSYKNVKNEITGVMEKIHYTQDEAYDAIKNLQTYADETSYSMDQMTSAMSQMVAAGVDLKQAEKNVQGIANACAAAGVNATEASRAFYNLSQAYSTGTLKYTDYRSLELLNMTNENFVDQLLNAAVEAGTITQKKDKKGNTIYKTSNKTDKKVTGGKSFSRNQAAEYLRYGYANKEVMNALFGNNFYVDVEDFYKAQEETEGLLGTEKNKARKEYLASLKDEDAIKNYIEKLKDDNDIKKAYKQLNSDSARSEYINNLAEEAKKINEIAEKYNGIDTNSIKDVFSKLDENDERRVEYKALKTEKEKQEYLKTIGENADLVRGYLEKEKRANNLAGWDTEKIESHVMSLDDNDARKKNLMRMADEGEERAAYIEELRKDNKTVKEIQEEKIEVTEESMRAYIESLDKNNKYRQKYEKLDAEGQKKYLQTLKRDADIAEKASKKSGGLDEEALEKYIMSLDKTNARRAAFEKMSLTQRKAYLKTMADEARALGKIGQKYSDISIEAFLAAREARNLGDVIKAVGDYVSSKFSKVFENLFGKLDEASNFFTDLAEGGIASLFMGFADWISDSAEAFNTGGVGSEIFRDSIIQLDSALGNMLGIFNDLLPSASEFGWQMQLVAGDISVALQHFNTWTQKFRMWINEEGRKERIQKIFANLSGVFGTAGKLIGIAFSTIGRALETFAPIADGIITLLGKLTDPIGRLGSRDNTEPFDKLSTAIENFFKIVDPTAKALGPVFDKLGNILGIVGDFFIQGAIDTVVMNIGLVGDALGLFIEIFGKWFGIEQSAQQENGTGVLDQMAADIQSLGDACMSAIGAVKEFFDNLFKDLRKLFGLTDEKDGAGAEGGFFTNVKNFFETNEFIKSAQAWFEQAKTDITTWFSKLPEKLNEFFTNMFFDKTEETDENGNVIQTITESKFKKFMDNLVTVVSQFITELPANLLKLAGQGLDFFGSILEAIFGKKNAPDEKNQNESENTAANVIHEWGETFLHNLKRQMRLLPIKIRAFIYLYKSKFKRTLFLMKEWFNTSETGKMIKEWGVSIVESIKKFIVELPNHIINIIKTVGSIGRTIIGAIKDAFKKEDVAGEVKDGVQDQLEEGFKGITIGGILKTIADIGMTIINQFLSWFTGTEDIETNIAWFTTTIVDFVKSIPGRIWKAAEDLGKEIIGVWDYIVFKFNENKEDDKTETEFEKNHPVIAKLVDNAVTFIQDIPTQLTNAFNQAVADVSGIWTGITNLLAKQDQIAELEERLKSDHLRPGEREAIEEELKILNQPTDFEKAHPQIARFVTSAKKWIDSIPKTLENAWNTASGKITEFIDGFKAFWKSLGNEEGSAEMSKDEAELAKKFADEHPTIAGWLIGAKKWFDETPKQIEDAINTAIEKLTGFFDGFKAFWKSLGNEEGSAEMSKDEAELAKKFADEHPTIAGWLTGAKTWFDTAPEQLENSINGAIDNIRATWTSFTNFLHNLDAIDQMQKSLDNPDIPDSAKDVIRTQMNIASAPTDFEKAHPQIASWVISARNWINGIHKSLDDAWQKAWGDIQGFFEGLDAYWEKLTKGEENVNDDVKKKAEAFETRFPGITSFVSDAKAWIESIPGQLKESYNKAAGEIGLFWKQFTGYLSTLDRRRELNKQLQDPSLSVGRKAELEDELAIVNQPTAFETNYSLLAQPIAGLTDWISTIPGMLSAAWDNARSQIEDTWKEFTEFWDQLVKGDGKEEADESPTKFEENHPQIAGFITNIVDWVRSIPDQLKGAYHDAINGVSEFYGQLTNYIGVLGARRDLARKIQQSTDPIEKSSLQQELLDANQPTDFEKNYAILAGPIASIIGWVDSIPGMISSSWETAKASVNQFWEDVVRTFNGEEIQNGEGLDSESFGTKIRGKIVGFFANLPGYITDGITAALGLINSAFTSLTEMLNSASDEVLTEEKIGENVSGAVKEFADATGEVAEEVGQEGQTPSKKFLEGIKKIGMTFWSIITETIPGFIVAGFNYVKTHWRLWANSLANIFSEVTGIKIDMSAIETTIRTAIENLPKSIGEAWDNVKGLAGGLFGKKKKELTPGMESLLNNPLESGETKRQLLESWNKAGYDVSKYVKQSSLWDNIQNIGEDIQTAFKSIFESDTFVDIGSFLLRIWTGLVDGVNKFFGMLGGWFTRGIKKVNEKGEEELNDETLGEAIEENYGAHLNSDLGKALSNLGTSIFNLFTHTIPQFLGSAAGTVINEIPNIVHSFMEGLQKALGNGIMSETPQVLNTVIGDMTAETTMTEKEAIQKMLEDSGYAAFLGSSDEIRKSINKERIKKGLEPYFIAQGKTIEKIIENLRNDGHVYSFLKKQSENKTLDEYIDWLNNDLYKIEDLDVSTQAANSAERAISNVGNIFEILFKMAFNVDKEGNVTGLSTWVWVAIGALLITKIIEFVDMIKGIPHLWSDKDTAKASNSIEAVMKWAMIALSIGAVFATVASQMDDAQFAKAKEIFDKVTGLITHITSLVGTAKIVDSVAGVVGAFSPAAGATVVSVKGITALATVGIIEEVKSVFDNLGIIITKISEGIASFAGNISNAAPQINAVSGDIDTIGSFIKSITKIVKDSTALIGYRDQVSTASEVMETLFNPIINMAGVIKNSGTAETLNALMQITSMTDEIGEFVKLVDSEDGTFDKFKYAISSLGAAMSFYSIPTTGTMTIDDEYIENTVKFLTSILKDNKLIDLADGLVKSTFGDDNLKMQKATEGLIIFAGGLAALGNAAAAFTEDSGSNINKFIAAINTIDYSSGLSTNMQESGIHDLPSDSEDLNTFSAAMNILGSALSELSTASGSITTERFEVLKQVLELLVSIGSKSNNIRSLTAFANSINTMGTNLGYFIGAINSGTVLGSYQGEALDDVKNRLTFAMGIVSQLAEAALMSEYMNVDAVISQYNNLNTMGFHLVDFISTIGGVDKAFSKANDNEQLTAEKMKHLLNIVNLFKEFSIGISYIGSAFNNGLTIGNIGSFMESLYDSKTKSGFFPSLMGIIRNHFMTLSDEQITRAQNTLPFYASLFEALSVCFTSIEGNVQVAHFASDAVGEALDYLNTYFYKIQQLCDNADSLDLDKLAKTRQLLSAVKELAEAMKAYYDINLPGQVNDVRAGLVSFSTFDYNLLHEGLTRFITGYTSVLEDEQNKALLNQGGYSMASILCESIQEALNSDDPAFHPVITPVLNDNQLRTDLSSVFGETFGTDFNFGDSFNAAMHTAFANDDNPIIHDYTQQLNDLGLKIEALSTHMDGIATNVSELQGIVQIDKDVLIGNIGPEIDTWLARQGTWYLRHNATVP